MKMLPASGCECLIEVRFDMEEAFGCEQWGYKGKMEQSVMWPADWEQYLFDLRNEGS